ncbi:MAG: damage-control phosphatase ARMT1 family protein [Promethearchaeota archaeon]
MKLYAVCMSCLINQIENAIRLTSPKTAEETIVAAQKKLMEVIAKSDLDEISNIIPGSMAYQIVGEVLGKEDPYIEIKEKYNRIAQELYPKAKEIINNSENPLLTAVRISILGNAIDFATPLEINFENEIDFVENNDLGGFEDLDSFIEKISHAKKIMILGDNTGEIVFDKLLVEKILELHPDKKLIYSVRRGPIVNDSTMKDAKFIGMDKLCKIVESSATTGVILEKCTPGFINEFNSADLIISKGQGNFEALIDVRIPCEDFYFLLKAKCDLMTRIFDLPLGSLILIKRKSELVNKVTNRL